jgi:hypothetical protein
MHAALMEFSKKYWTLFSRLLVKAVSMNSSG